MAGTTVHVEVTASDDFSGNSEIGSGTSTPVASSTMAQTEEATASGGSGDYTSTNFQTAENTASDNSVGNLSTALVTEGSTASGASTDVTTIVLIAIASAIVLFLATALFVWFIRRTRKSRSETLHNDNDLLEMNGVPNEVRDSSLSTSTLTNDQCSKISNESDEDEKGSVDTNELFRVSTFDGHWENTSFASEMDPGNDSCSSQELHEDEGNNPNLLADKLPTFHHPDKTSDNAEKLDDAKSETSDFPELPDFLAEEASNNFQNDSYLIGPVVLVPFRGDDEFVNGDELQQNVNERTTSYEGESFEANEASDENESSQVTDREGSSPASPQGAKSDQEGSNIESNEQKIGRDGGEVFQNNDLEEHESGTEQERDKISFTSK